MLKIGDFSRLSRMSIRMLRHYDEIGLLTPASIDPESGYRYYAVDQLLTAQRISELRDMGFGLSAIGGIMASYDDPKALSDFLTIRQKELLAELDDAQSRLRLLDTAITRLRKDNKAMNYNVTLKTTPQLYVASVRQLIPAYDQESALWGVLCSETAGLDLKPADSSCSIAVFHDKEYKEGPVDVEIQAAVKGSYADTEHVRFKTVAPMQVASATYKGGYENIAPVNHAVAAWVRDNGYEFSGPMFCIYHVSPAQTSDPSELVTEVCYPVSRG